MAIGKQQQVKINFFWRSLSKTIQNSEIKLQLPKLIHENQKNIYLSYVPLTLLDRTLLTSDF